MAPKQRVIIDTDPGIDDILALLLAFASSPDELEIPLVSITHGNVDVQSCLRNVVSLFHIIEKEQQWREKKQRPQGFETIKACKPVVAVGAEAPLEDQLIMADFFHGADGLGGIHNSHPEFTPSETWRSLFKRHSSGSMNSLPANSIDDSEMKKATEEHHLFTPSLNQAHKEILRVLAENPPQTITIIAIGPLTNLALAAAEDTETFLRAKEVVVMGGAIDMPGNITPLAEFNTHADAVAAARLYALTSPTPATTMPPSPQHQIASSPTSPSPLQPYKSPLPGPPLRLTLFPLDITTSHRLTHEVFTSTTSLLRGEGSPLAAWAEAFMSGIWARASSETNSKGLSLHDPLCVYYALSHPSPAYTESDVKNGVAGTARRAPMTNWDIAHDKDVRVETMSQWSRGACITDRRGRQRADVEVPGDRQGWLSSAKGNRLSQALRSPEDVRGEGFARELMERVFGVELSGR